MGLFQACCLSGRGKSRTRGMLEGAFAAPTHKRQRAPPQKTSEAGKVAEILGPSIAIERTAGTSRFPLVLIPRDPLCSSFVYLHSRRHPGWQLTNTPSSNEFQKIRHRSLAARYGLPPRTPEEMGAWEHRSKPISPEAN